MRVKDMVLFKPQIIGEKDIDGGTELVSRVFGMESYMIVESDRLGYIKATLNHPFNGSLLTKWCPDIIEVHGALNYLKNEIMDRIERRLSEVREAEVKQGVPHYQRSVQFNVSDLCPVKSVRTVNCYVRLDRRAFFASMELNGLSIDIGVAEGKVFKSALWAIRRKLFEGVC